jgi:DNA polymerase III subunit delta
VDAVRLRLLLSFARSEARPVADSTHALDILLAPDKLAIETPSIVVLHGDEPFLARHVLLAIRDRLVPDEADRSWAWREFDGTEPLDPRDVLDEAATMPLFATATRAAVVRRADAFVTASREVLERIAGSPRGGRGLVILELKTFPATTRLAKAAAKHGLVIDTAVPPRKDLAGWVRKWAQTAHGISLAPATAEQLVERLGRNLGLVEQALARLTAATAEASRRTPVPPEAIDAFAAPPGQRPAWGMIDAAASGDTPRALAELAEILETGESPIALAAQTSAVLRKLAAAARLLALPAGQGRPAGVEQALREAGVAAWPQALAQARAGLGQLGAARAPRLPIWLRDLDLALKGDASRGLRARLALERLFCKMTRAGADAPTGGPRATGRRPR